MALELTGTVHIAPSTDELYDDLANILLLRASDAVKERGVFHLALSGGSTPEAPLLSTHSAHSMPLRTPK